MAIHYRNILYIALGTVLLLLVPFYWTMTGGGGGGWQWIGFDYVFAFVVIFGVGALLEVVRQKAGSGAYKAAAGLALVTVFLLVWINAAVGIISEDEWPNVAYLGMVAAGFVGAALSRLKPLGMSYTMFVMAAAQVVVPTIALVASPELMAQPPGAARVFMLSAVFALMWVVSGLLFRHAAQRN